MDFTRTENFRLGISEKSTSVLCSNRKSVRVSPVSDVHTNNFVFVASVTGDLRKVLGSIANGVAAICCGAGSLTPK